VDLVRGGLLMLVYAVGYTFGSIRPIRRALTFPRFIVEQLGSDAHVNQAVTVACS
jgi:hypothetical protein